ncbi:LysR family transcriptional regulator [Blastomonas sp.]|uniref:LysR family transcriptional regulator n=1 Tax=Blastomonas sp. TaxID=1909299 RepID=UPI00406A3345
MDISLLDDFLTLIDCGNFSRAAEKRDVSQPSFSRRIRTLESWVGADLIDRSTHTVRLTAAGDRFRTTAEETLRRLQLGREGARAAAKASSETLRFASTHVLSLTFFPSWLRTFEMNAERNVTIELIADNMVACERLMIEGRAQFLLCHHHEAADVRLGADFRSVALGSDILLPVAAPEVVVEGRMADAPQLAFTSGSGMGRILAAAWSARGLLPPPRPAFASHLASVLAAMARDGRGVTWSPLSLIEDDLAAGRLVRIGTESDEVPMEIRLWRPKARQSPAAEAFWARLAKTCQAEAA